jgi:16S rRNA (adenine1518-N6/adenine1519-N6)-dimethyltransferase
MALYKPSELNAFLQTLGIAPKKGLSQNFLIDGNIIRNILAAASLESGDSVLEVGPGPGALTEALLNAHANVVVVEMDKTLAEALNRLPHEPDQLKVIQGDILKTSWNSIGPRFPNTENKVKLIANLPYHITTPVLEKFVPMREEIESIVVMVQNEVGKRMAAEAGTKDFGSLSLFLSFYAKVEYQFKVGRRCFFPAPKVDSAVVKLTLRPTPEGIDAEAFFTVTRTAFQQRRKSLRASLKSLYSSEQIEEALSHLGLQPLTRPEELSLDLWCALFRKLSDISV